MAASPGQFRMTDPGSSQTQNITWSEFIGLDLQADALSHPPNSWRRAENVDLFIPGAVRKIVGPEVAFQTPSPIVEMLAYTSTPTSTLMRMGVGLDGNLYSLETNQNFGNVVTPGSQPFVATLTGTIAGGNESNYLYFVFGGQPNKWEPTGGVTQVGVSPPAAPVTISKITNSATNAHAYLMQVGIQYLWTYFNPTTLNESSPSPVTNASIITPTVNTPPPATPYTLSVELNIPTPAPSIGTGYTNIRLYRTQDGGATFYLMPAVYDAKGNKLTDANLSIPIQGATTIAYDGVENTNVSPAVHIAPTQDQVLVNPPGGAPEIDANNPPPAAIWGAVYQSRLWLLDTNKRRLWFSNIGQYEQFGVYNYFDFSKDIEDSVTALVALSDRLLVFGKNTARQITGTDFSSFVLVPIDMRRGCQGFRMAVNDGDKVYALSPQSLVRLSFSEGGPPFIGDKVKLITDNIQQSTFPFVGCMDIDSIRGILFFFFKINGVTYNDQAILIDLSRSPDSPFTSMVGLPAEVISCRELEAPDGTKDIYFSCNNNTIYRVYSKNQPTVGTFVATLETQKLPMDQLDVWKVYRRLSLFGRDLPNWQVQYSTDGVNFKPPTPLNYVPRIPIGYAGEELVIRFIHQVSPATATTGILLSKGIFTFTSKMSRR